LLAAYELAVREAKERRPTSNPSHELERLLAEEKRERATR
jgi:hypothetical protein